MKNAAFLFAATLTIGVCSPTLVFSTTNIISREIRADGDQLCVFDMLLVEQGFANRDNNLYRLCDAVQNPSRELTEEVRRFLAPDSVELVTYSATNRGELFHIQITSRVRFLTNSAPSPLRWVPTFGAQGITFPNVNLVSSNPAQMHVFAESNTFILSFPDLGPPRSDQLRLMDGIRKGMHFIHDEDVEFRCILKTKDGDRRLFSLNRSPTTVPSTALIGRVHELHNMRMNDFISLLTNFKVAKPGFYLIQ